MEPETRVTDRPGVEIHRVLEPESRRRQLAQDVRTGFAGDSKVLPPKYFYDDRGSRLFEAITRLPAYYQTRTERSILEERSSGLVEALQPEALVEYGSGAAAKTRVLLAAMARRDLLTGYAPIDVSPEPVRRVAGDLTNRYPDLEVVGIIGDFESPIDLPFDDRPRLVLFLGGTIGNFRPAAAARFLGRVSSQMNAADGLLVGFDLVKDPAVLLAAYDDDQGVTAEFNRNVLRVLNRELGADFDVDAFRHRADWNPGEERIEMRLVSERPQTVRIRDLEMEVAFEEGEAILTELSHKFTRDSAGRLLSEAGLRLDRWLTDPDERFALALGACPRDPQA